jgi:hypothetical protein
LPARISNLYGKDRREIILWELKRRRQSDVKNAFEFPTSCGLLLPHTYR